MTAPRRHGANDGSLARSAGDAATRGAALIAVAVVIGLLLLWKGYDDNSAVATGDGGDVAADTSGDAADGADGDGTNTGGDSVDSTTDGDTTDGGTDTDGADSTDGADGGDTDGTGGTDATTPPVDCSTVGGDIPRPSNEVQVIAANGSGVAGEAGRMASQLSAANYVATAKNTLPSPTEVSRILYRDCHSQDALTVAALIGAGAAPIELLAGSPPVDGGDDQALIDTADVFVVMGTDRVIAAS